MATLILDIKTVGEDWNTLDVVTQRELTAWINDQARDLEEVTKLTNRVKRGLPLSPFTAQLVSLALYDVERAAGTVYYTTTKEADREEGPVTYKARSEAELLFAFWSGIPNYDTLVTFGGRQFDLPFLVHRSLINHIVPTVNASPMQAFHLPPLNHIDLQDECTFKGAWRRRVSLHLVCRAYGVKSPQADGVSVGEVAHLAMGGHFIDIARYNWGDVTAIAELYERWRPTFSNID